MTTVWPPIAYPTGLDTFLPALLDGVDEVIDNHPNTLAAGVIALESKLGVDGGLISSVGGVEFEGSLASPGNITVWVDTILGPGNYNLYYTDETGTDYLIGGPGFVPGGGTLDSAYDFGGPGVGRFITASDGSVVITVPNTSNNVGLSIIQNDTTNDLDALLITNNATFVSGSYSIELAGSNRSLAAKDDGVNTGINLLYLANNAAPLGERLFNIIGHTIANEDVRIYIEACQSGAGTGEGFVQIEADAGIYVGGVYTPYISIGNNPFVDLINIGANAVNSVASRIINIGHATPNNVLTSIYAGANADLIFGARSGTVTLNELGHTSLVGFTATSIIGALNELKTGVGAVTLDVAYKASAGVATITINAGDINWNSTGAYSSVFDLTAATGTADGVHVENGTDYIRFDHAAADQIALTAELLSGVVNASTTFSLTAAGATSDLTLGGRGTTVTLNELGHTSLVGFTATSIIGALNELKTGVGAVTLDVAYKASAGVATITINAGDINWNSTGAYSSVFDLTAATGTADGVHVENGTDYIRFDHAAADQIALTAELLSGVVNASTTLILQSSGYKIEHDGANYKRTVYSGGKTTYHQAPIELADDASFTLPTSSSGWGTFTLSENSEYAEIRWNGLGDVYIKTSSANVDTADTDGKFCLYNDSGTVRIKNRLGSSKRCFFDYDYNINYVTFSATDDLTLKMTATAGAYVLVDWGDLTSTTWVCDGSEQTVLHNYAGAGSYTVKIYGDLESITTFNLNNQANVAITTTEISKLTSLTRLVVYQANLSGLIQTLNALKSLTYLDVAFNNLLIGTISGLTSLSQLATGLIYYCGALTGDIRLFLSGSPLLTLLALKPNPGGAAYDMTYTTGALQAFAGADLDIRSTGLTSTMVDDFLIDFADGIGTPIALNIAGTNAARTAASDAAKAVILATGCVLTVNE